MNIQEWNNWLENIVLTFSQDFGVSTFFSNPNQAATWVQTKVIDPNPRLSNIEKDVLTQSSNEARIYANSEVATTSISSREGALIYWELMQISIVLNTNDQKLFDLFEVGVDAAKGTTLQGQKENLPRTPVKIPWWVWLLPLAFLLRRK